MSTADAAAWLAAILLCFVGLATASDGARPPTTPETQRVGFCFGFVCCLAALFLVASA